MTTVTTTTLATVEAIVETVAMTTDEDAEHVLVEAVKKTVGALALRGFLKAMGKKVLVFKIFFLLCFLASGQSVLFDPFTKPEDLTLKQLELKAFEIEKQSRLSHYLQGIYFLQKLRGSEEGYEKSWRAAHFTGVTVAMSVYRFLTHISQSNYDFYERAS